MPATRRFLPIAILLACSVFPSTAATVPFASGFLENRGQWDPAVRFAGAFGGADVYLTDGAVVVVLLDAPALQQRATREEGRLSLGDPPAPRKGCALYLRFDGAHPSPQIEAGAALPGRYHFLHGSDPSGWRTDVTAHDEIVYRDLWPGVDLSLREEAGRIVYEARGSHETRPVRFRYEGADRVVPQRDGTLLLETRYGNLRVTGDGTRGALVREGPAREGPDERVDGAREPARDNPSALLWSTCLGGISDDMIDEVDFDSFRNPIVAGLAASSDFPTTPGSFEEDHNGGEYDAVVAKLSSSGDQLLWCTFLGGTGSDRAFALAVDGADRPVLAGDTASDDFPTTPGSYDPIAIGGLFITKLEATGDALVWSTYIDAWATCGSLTLDPDENPVITGWAYNDDFPTTPGAYDPTYNGGDLERTDPYVLKLAADGSDLVWSTFLGGALGDDFAWDVAVSPSGRVGVAGFTAATDYPTSPGAFDAAYNGGIWDGFVTVLDPSGSELVFSSFLGGSAMDRGLGIDFGGSDEPVVTGWTQDATFDFPTTPGAFQTTTTGGPAFVTKFTADGDSLLWSTFCGGTDGEEGRDLEVDPAGNVVLVGRTGSEDFPTTMDGYDTTPNGHSDGFVAQLSSTGSELLWGSYFGGPGEDWGYNVGLANGIVYFVGQAPAGYPTTPDAFDPTNNGVQDGFVTAASLVPLETCFHLDFDEDDDPYTVRTELPMGVDSALVRFVLEVPTDNPRGESFRFEITEDCCEDPFGNAVRAMRLDPASLALDPARVEEVEVLVPPGSGCAPWTIEGRFASVPFPPPGQRFFFGSAMAHVWCGDFPEGCEPTHQLETSFHVFGGSNCAQSHTMMTGACDPAGVAGEVAGAREVGFGLPYPNPGADRVRIALWMPAAGRARIEAFDAGGRRIAVVADRSFTQGESSLDWEAAGLAAGVYFLRLDALATRRSCTVVLGR